MNILSLILSLLLGVQQGGVLAGTRTGVITGQVRSPGGEPVSGIRVAAMEAPEMGNQDSAVSTIAGLTTTDATGHFRLEDIPVGKYFVVAGSLDTLSYYPTSVTVTSVTPVNIVDFFLSDVYDGVIDVTVHRVGSPAPVPRNEVKIRSNSTSFSRTLDTNDKGIASFSGIPYGDYLVSTSMIAMSDALSGANTSAPLQDLSVTITINPNRPKWAVSLGLLLPGMIRGVVRDVDGNPVANVAVSSMNIGYQNGNRTLVPESSTRTGLKGEYELPASPGDHFIRATLSAVDSYYPATTSPMDAKTVRIVNGVDVGGVDVQVAKTYSVRARVEKLRPESPAPSFVLVSRYGLDSVVPLVRYNAEADGGTFELRGIPPGPWELFAISGTGIPELHQTGKVAIEVGNRDIDGVTIPMQAATIRGRIVGLGNDPATVQLVPVETINDALTDAVPGLEFPAPGGEFAFSNIPALRYRTVVNGLPLGWYVSDIRMGDTSIFNDNIINVGATPLAPLRIEVSSGAGLFRGTVEGIPANSKISNARVVLVPDASHRQNVLMYRTALIQGNGSFVINPSPAPGNYMLFAVSNLPAGHAEWNAEFMQKYADVAIPVTVLPSQPTNAKVNLTPAR